MNCEKTQFFLNTLYLFHIFYYSAANFQSNLSRFRSSRFLDKPPRPRRPKDPYGHLRTEAVSIQNDFVNNRKCHQIRCIAKVLSLSFRVVVITGILILNYV